METGTNWIAILGFVFGVAAFLRWVFHDIADTINRPKLIIRRGPYALNWTSLDTEETRRFIHFEVISRKGKTARHCLAKAKIIKYPENMPLLQEEYSLHWADVPYSTVGTEEVSVDIRGETKRLDIAFTVSYLDKQSWVATHLALAVPGKVAQATLPKGEYTLEVAVSCENGWGDIKTIKLTSPDNWESLQAEKV